MMTIQRQSLPLVLFKSPGIWKGIILRIPLAYASQVMWIGIVEIENVWRSD